MKHMTDVYTWIYFVLTGVGAVSALWVATLLRRRGGSAKRIVVEAECPRCSYRGYVGYSEGLYVGKRLQQRCPRCGAELVVSAIYEEAPPCAAGLLFASRGSGAKDRQRKT